MCVCVSDSSLHLRVTQQFPDHRQALAKRQRSRSIRMAEVMNSYVFQSGAPADAAPGLLQIGDVGARQLAGDDLGIVVLAGKVGQDGTGLRSERHGTTAGLGIP